MQGKLTPERRPKQDAIFATLNRPPPPRGGGQGGWGLRQETEYRKKEKRESKLWEDYGKQEARRKFLDRINGTTTLESRFIVNGGF